jgi:hypothetical protein
MDGRDGRICMQFRIGSDVGREQALSELFCHGPKFKVDHRSIHCVCVLLFFLSVAHLLLITSCHANNYLTNKDDLLILFNTRSCLSRFPDVLLVVKFDHFQSLNYKLWYLYFCCKFSLARSLAYRVSRGHAMPLPADMCIVSTILPTQLDSAVHVNSSVSQSPLCHRIWRPRLCTTMQDATQCKCNNVGTPDRGLLNRISRFAKKKTIRHNIF